MTRGKQVLTQRRHNETTHQASKMSAALFESVDSLMVVNSVVLGSLLVLFAVWMKVKPYVPPSSMPTPPLVPFLGSLKYLNDVSLPLAVEVLWSLLCCRARDNHTH